ncbi:PilN domain-containing protein [Myxococcota bacterium]|nr:PilN domain-containing protein [Myxococcota bacterium]
MIRINLLPVRQTRKKAAVQRHLAYFGVGLVAVVAVCAWRFVGITRQVTAAETENRELRTEIEDLKRIVGKVEEFEKIKQELEKKLSVINDLRAHKTGPVHVLDEIATRIPEKLWITSLETAGNRIKLSGQAVNNETVATFMSSLEDSAYFGEVFLEKIEQAAEKRESATKMKLFQVTAVLRVPGA